MCVKGEVSAFVTTLPSRCAFSVLKIHASAFHAHKLIMDNLRVAARSFPLFMRRLFRPELVVTARRVLSKAVTKAQAPVFTGVTASSFRLFPSLLPERDKLAFNSHAKKNIPSPSRTPKMTLRLNHLIPRNSENNKELTKRKSKW